MKTIILMLILFALLIFPHELGHFFAAKACGVKVNEFAFGMGPTLFSHQGVETLYAVRAIPFGGFCRMEGEDTEVSESERAFGNRKWWQKIIILAAGAIMNIIVCIIALSIVTAIIIGVNSPADFFEAIGHGVAGTGRMLKMILEAFGGLIVHPDKDAISGPVGIAGFVKQAGEQGVAGFLYLLAIISANLAVFNLLPLPALDGGRIIFVFIRLVTGKAITDKQEGLVHVIGMMLLLMLMIFATWNDIVKLLT